MLWLRSRIQDRRYRGDSIRHCESISDGMECLLRHGNGGHLYFVFLGADLVRFLFNPFTIATCLGRSTGVFTTTGILYAFSSAVTGNSLNAMLSLGLASYLSIYPALLFIPLVLLCYDQRVQKTKVSSGTLPFALQHFAVFLTCILGLLSISTLLIGDFYTFISATYGFHLLVPDLTPQRWPMVVLLHRNLRFFPRVLPWGVLASLGCVHGRSYCATAPAAFVRADVPFGDFCHFQTIS